MGVIRTAAILWCILFMGYNASVSGEPSGWGAKPDAKPAALADSAAAPRYREAEPALLVAERERPLPSVVLETPRKGIRLLVNALLVITAAFTVFSFLGIRKPGGAAYREERVHRRKKSRKSSDRTPVSREDSQPVAERERPQQNPRERAESLKARRVQIAEKIDRLMKRL